MARSRCPSWRERSTESNMAMTSSTVRTDGRAGITLGERSLSQGLAPMRPSASRKVKKAFRELTRRAWERFPTEATPSDDRNAESSSVVTRAGCAASPRARNSTSLEQSEV